MLPKARYRLHDLARFRRICNDTTYYETRTHRNIDSLHVTLEDCYGQIFKRYLEAYQSAIIAVRTYLHTDTASQHGRTTTRCKCSRVILESTLAPQTQVRTAHVANTTSNLQSQVAPLPTNLPFRIVSKTIGSGAYASYASLPCQISLYLA